MLSLSHTLDAQLRAAMARAFPEADGPLDPQLAPASKTEFGLSLIHISEPTRPL